MTPRLLMSAVLLAVMFLKEGWGGGTALTAPARPGPPPPSCAGLPDGLNADLRRKWSPYFIACRSQQVVYKGTCPSDPKLSISRLFHAVKRHCVTPYEIPRRYSSISISCASKEDGLHLDDVTKRPDVYYRCLDEKLVSIHKCEDGQYFDEALVTCSARPLYNSITGPMNP